MFFRFFPLALLLFLTAVSGCASMNRTKQIPGVPLPSERVKEIQQLGENAGMVPEDEREGITSALTEIIHQETDPLIRRTAVLAISHYPGPMTVDSLKFAEEDNDKEVRLAVCKSWQIYNSEESVPALINILAAETDLDIRLEIIEILGQMKDKRAIPAMIVPLSSSDPALHHYCVVALQEITGFNGTDPHQWLAYCRKEIDQPGHKARSWFQK